MFVTILSLLTLSLHLREISAQTVTGVCFCVTQGSCTNTGGIGTGVDGSGMFFNSTLNSILWIF